MTYKKDPDRADQGSQVFGECNRKTITTGLSTEIQVFVAGRFKISAKVESVEFDAVGCHVIKGDVDSVAVHGGIFQFFAEAAKLQELLEQPEEPQPDLFNAGGLDHGSDPALFVCMIGNVAEHDALDIAVA